MSVDKQSDPYEEVALEEVLESNVINTRQNKKVEPKSKPKPTTMP